MNSELVLITRLYLNRESVNDKSVKGQYQSMANVTEWRISVNHSSVNWEPVNGKSVTGQDR